MTFANTSSVEANASLFSLFERIWNSLDDILVCFGIFLVFAQVSKSMYGCLRNYFSLSFYVSQAVHFLLLSTIVIFLIGHLVGTETAISFLGGLSIGLGYALQPYIVSLLAGGTLLSMHQTICIPRRGKMLTWMITPITTASFSLILRRPWHGIILEATQS